MLETFLISAICLFLYIRLPDSNESIVISQTNEFIRSIAPYSLNLAAAALLILCVLHVSVGKKVRSSGILSPYLIALFLFALRIFDYEQFSKSFSGVLVIAMFVVLSGRFKKLKRQLNYNISVEYGLFIFFFIMLATSIYLYSQGLGYYGFSNRFAGLSFHPNQFGLICALSVVFFYGVFHEINANNYKKIIMLIALLFSFFFLLASGSRGSLLAAIAGVVYFSVKIGVSIGRWLFTVIILTLGLKVYSSLGENSMLMFDRYKENVDTRSGVFHSLLDGFLSSPLVGVGSEAVGSENSYLKALAIGGLLCGFPLVIFAFKLVIFLYRKVKLEKYKLNKLNELKFGAMLVSILIASMVDGYLFERFGLTAFILIIVISSWPYNQMDRTLPVYSQVRERT